MPVFWLSFADNGFRGVVVTEAEDLRAAIRRTHRLGINPGGQIMSWEVTAEDVVKYERDRLYTKDELKAIEPMVNMAGGGSMRPTGASTKTVEALWEQLCQDDGRDHCFHIVRGPWWMVVPDGHVLEKCCKCPRTRTVHAEHRK